jgi:hypothetical protein
VELRQQIYDLHLKQATILIQELNDGNGRYQLSSAVRVPDMVPGPGQKHLYPRSLFAREPNQVLRLPLVCQQIYCETIEYIYRMNTFEFRYHAEALLLPTLSIFPQKHLAKLRSLEFRFCIDVLAKDLGFGKWQSDSYYERTVAFWTASSPGKARQRRKWTAFWTFLATLPNLQRLHVAFTRLPGPDTLADNCVFWWILAPLLQFNKRERLAVFEVEWQRSTKGWRLPDGWKKAVPFQVVWIPGGMASGEYGS